MTDDRATFETTKARLDEIVVEVNKKDTSLDQSIELLEEGVRLMNTCNEVIDQTWWRRDDDAADEADPQGEDAGEDEAGEDEAGEDEAGVEAPADPTEDDERS